MQEQDIDMSKCAATHDAAAVVCETIDGKFLAGLALRYHTPEGLQILFTAMPSGLARQIAALLLRVASKADEKNVGIHS